MYLLRLLIRHQLQVSFPCKRPLGHGTMLIVARWGVRTPPSLTTLVGTSNGAAKMATKLGQSAAQLERKIRPLYGEW